MISNRMLFVLTMVLAYLLIGSNAYASNSIDVETLSFSDVRPTIGDVVLVDFRFETRSSGSQKVVVYVYVDGKLHNKKTEYLYDGVYERRFYIDTYDLERGTYDVRITAKIYDDRGYIDDTDTKNKYLYVKGEVTDSRVCYHYYDDYYTDYYYDGYCYTYTPTIFRVDDRHITITQVAYDKAAAKYEKIPVKIYVKNDGKYTESVKLSVEINGVATTTDRELIYSGDERARIVYVNAPGTIGTHNIRIKAESYNDQHIVEDFLEVIGTTLSATINPKDTAKTGEWIHIYGYAMDGNYGSDNAVRIYKDSSYIEQVMPKSTGYYSAYVRFYDAGEHMIRVRVGSLEKTKQIFIEGAPKTTEPITYPIVTDVTDTSDTKANEKEDTYETTTNNYNITNNNITNNDITNNDITKKYYTVVVVTDENKTVTVDGTDITITVDSPEEEIIEENMFEFVDVNVNSKVLNIEQYSGNTLKITVTNHMNKAKLFSIETDFDDSLAFVSGPVVVASGETKILPVYFSTRGIQGKYDGTIKILQDGVTIKDFPVTIHVVAQREKELPASKADFGLIGVYAIIALFFLFLVALGYFAMTKTRTKESMRPFEPRFIRSSIGKYIPKKSQSVRKTTWPAKKTKDVYEVPWENVIY